MYQICDYQLDSIKRVMNTDNFILITKYIGIKLLSISDLVSIKFSIQDLLEVDDQSNYTENLQV
jgi:hypothetical protein